MPAVPSASYFEEGFVMTSTCSMLLAGSCCKIFARLSLVRPEGFPSIKIVTFSLPRRLTFPSISTLTDGIFCSTSLTFPPTLIKFLSTLYTFLSRLLMYSAFSPVTVASFKFFKVGTILIIPISLVGSSGLINIGKVE